MIFAFSLVLTSLIAQNTDSITDTDINLDEIVVTGTRAPKLLKRTPVQTILISAKDIARTDATDIQGLLQQEMPGVEFTYAMNQQTHMNIGGFGGQSVLFLIDGERLAGETMDDVDFSRIEMAGVQRIEIVRGASSALYGSNAAGGVINIITREPDRKWSGNVNARIARHAEQRYGLNMSYRNSLVRNTLSATYSRINSYDVNSAPDPLTRVVTTIYGNRTLNVKDQLSITPMDGLKFTARAGYYFKEIPRIYDTPERYRDFSGGLRGLWDITAYTNVDVAYSFDQYDKSNYQRISGLDVRNYRNVLNSVRGVLNHTTARGDVFTFGADYRYDFLDNTKITDGSKHESNADAFVQYDYIIDDKWEVVGALRYDYFSAEKKSSRLTPKISARYKPTYNMNVRLAYGMGFRTPTLKEKYYNFDMAGIWIVKGNPALKPESSQNINASFDWSHKGYNVTVTTYYNHVLDKIATGLPYYMPDDPRQLYLDYVNLDKYDVFGAELTLQARWKCGLSSKLSYAYTHEMFAKDKDGNTANNQYIPARRHSLTARVEWNKRISRSYEFTVGLNGRALSGVTNIEYKDYYDISVGTVRVHYPPYTLWKLSTSHMLMDRFKLTLAVDNLFNYKPKYYYLNAPLTDGVNVLAGLSIDI
ncbi:MAG: TonB-dependent receptor [Muribaculaceae bacterium]|nr:TonB-dependent receptor [Muribaculaceae bacterium]